MITMPINIQKSETKMQETISNSLLNEGICGVQMDMPSSQRNDDSRIYLRKLMHMRPTRSKRKHKETHRLVKQPDHIDSISEINTQNLPDDVIDAVLHCLTHKDDCSIPQCSCRRVKSKISEIKVIPMVKSRTGIDHSSNTIMAVAGKQFKEESHTLPSICVNDIPLPDDNNKSFEANDSDVIRVEHQQCLDTLTYDSGVSFDSVGSCDAEDF